MGSPDLPPRGGRRSPLVADDGFGPHAITIDEATGCQLWQGNMNGPEPRASHRMTTVKPRLLAFERAYGPLPAGYRLAHCPHARRCIRPDHQAATLIEPRSGRTSRVRGTLAGRLPSERPAELDEREWQALCGVVAGETYAEITTELGISRQRAHQLVERARRTLG